MSKFKKCINGHTYKADLEECPICKNRDNVGFLRSKSQTTQIIDGLDDSCVGTKTSNADDPMQAVRDQNVDPRKEFSRTMVEEEVLEEDESGSIVNSREVRIASKLVGWLVTYDLDPNGVDFRIYEGRNIIGRDFSCSVCISDKKVSAQHATLLYRNDKFRIKDNLSVNGTMVNGKDIDDDSEILKDGDIIKVGDTNLLFRTAVILPK